MDVNGTRYHLLLGRDDWGRRCKTISRKASEHFAVSETGGEADVSWDARRHEITLGSRVFYFASSPGNQPADVAGRRGSAADRHGSIYWIAGNKTEVLVNSAGSRATTHFWSSMDGLCEDTPGLFSSCRGDTEPAPLVLSGLAVTTEHYLAVGTIDPKGLLIFDLQHGGEPRQLLWPAHIAFEPFDFAAAHDGGLWILDRQNRRVWQLDRTFSVAAVQGTVPPPAGSLQFVPLDGSPANPPSCHGIVDTSMALTLSAPHLTAIEALPDGSILILESDPAKAFSEISRYRDGAMVGAPASTEPAKMLVEESKRAAFRLLGHDFAYVESTLDGTRDVLYVVGSEGDQAVGFEMTLSDAGLVLKAIADFFPMRLFGAKALIAANNQPLYDSQDRWVPLVAQRRARFARQATLFVSPLDGREPDCVWHRLMLDGCIPPECDVKVWSRASDDENLLPFAEWYLEPRLMRRRVGSELPWVNDTRGTGNDTWELLFQRAKGRYLELKLELTGSGRSTPRFRALRAWYPRFSYLNHYLPAVYRENEESASFLDRFLANIEGFFTNIEDRIAATQSLLDARSAPNETLDWLASWFGVALDPAWDQERRRLFIRYAAEFFEWRGTAPGVLMALRLIFEHCADESIFALERKQQRSAIRIVEQFRMRGLPPVVLTALNDTDGLPLRERMEKWDPSQGAADLHRRWAEYVQTTGALYPIQPPDRHDDSYAPWAAFSMDTLGFVPRSAGTDADLWREALRRRYSTVEQLGEAWNATYDDWSNVSLPNALPEDPEALLDWIHFEAIALPARDAAHRFVVFLPQGTLGMSDREKRVDLARRVIALEKPAHTTFDVKFYWAFFRVGDARVGNDTFIDRGSRSEELLSPFVLDRNYLGSGWLASEHAGRPASTCACPPLSTGGSA